MLEVRGSNPGVSKSQKYTFVGILLGPKVKQSVEITTLSAVKMYMFLHQFVLDYLC
jgi:hypothetical protein